MKIICIGRNYREHATELKNPVPGEPFFFMKPETALIRAGLPFFYPDFSGKVHYEAELVLRICKLGKHIQARFARNYFKEIGVGIDFTARDIQERCKEKGLPWEAAKAFDGSAPVSKFVPIARFCQSSSISFHLDLNGETVQKGNTGDMIFSFEEIISHVSRYVTLKIGDLIFTGTPSGVGEVKMGDRLEAFLEKEKMLTINIK